MRMRSDDRELVERVLSGDGVAFEELVGKYQRLGGAIAFGILGDFQLAEDAVQDAFLKAYRSLAALQQPSKFRVWFSGIVRKRSIDVLRQRRRPIQRASSLDAAERAADNPGGESPRSSSLASDARRSNDAGQRPAIERLVRREERRQVLDCVAHLSQEDRAVVVLKHMDGLSYKEIAEVTGSTVAAVESRLFRARHALKRKLARLLEKGDPDPGS